MAAAAMQAFSDLQAQFAARGGLVPVPPPSGGTNASRGAAPGSNPLGGFFGRESSATKPAANRPETRFAAKETKGVVVYGDGDASFVVSGAGDVEEASGAFDAGSGSFYARPAAGIEPGAAASGRARLAGRLVVRGGSAPSRPPPRPRGDAPVPLFPRRTRRVRRRGANHDADWLDEGAYKCPLRCRLDPNKPLAYAVTRGAAPGETPDVFVRVSAGARFELQGGTVSAQASAIGWESDGGDVVFDGVWDVAPRVEATFRTSDGEGMRVDASGTVEWPWRRRVDPWSSLFFYLCGPDSRDVSRSTPSSNPSNRSSRLRLFFWSVSRAREPRTCRIPGLLQSIELDRASVQVERDERDASGQHLGGNVGHAGIVEVERGERGQSAKRRGDGEAAGSLSEASTSWSLAHEASSAGSALRRLPATLSFVRLARAPSPDGSSVRAFRDRESVWSLGGCPGGVGGEARDAVAVEDERAELDAFAQLARDLDEVVGTQSETLRFASARIAGGMAVMRLLLASTVRAPDSKTARGISRRPASRSRRCRCASKPPRDETRSRLRTGRPTRP